MEEESVNNNYTTVDWPPRVIDSLCGCAGMPAARSFALQTLRENQMIARLFMGHELHPIAPGGLSFTQQLQGDE